MDREAWRAAIHGVAKSRTRLKRLSSSSSGKIFYNIIFKGYSLSKLSLGKTFKEEVNGSLVWPRLALLVFSWRKKKYKSFQTKKTSTSSVQFSPVAQSCPTLRNPMNRSTPGLSVHHHPLEFTQTHVHRVRDAIQPSHPRLSPFPPAPNPSQHQSLFQWVSFSHEVAKVLELQLFHIIDYLKWGNKTLHIT